MSRKWEDEDWAMLVFLILILLLSLSGCNNMPSHFESLGEARAEAEAAGDSERIQALLERENELYEEADRAVQFYDAMEKCNPNFNLMRICNNGPYLGPPSDGDPDKLLRNYRLDRSHCGCSERSEFFRQGF